MLDFLAVTELTSTLFKQTPRWTAAAPGCLCWLPHCQPALKLRHVGASGGRRKPPSCGRGQGRSRSPCGGMVPVLPGLYVGGAESCSSSKALAAAGVMAVLTVDAEEPPPLPGVRTLYIRALDEPGADLLSRLDECAAFIGAARAGGGAVLVRW